MVLSHKIQAMVLSDIIHTLNDDIDYHHLNFLCDIRTDLIFKRGYLIANDFIEIADELIKEYFPSMQIIEINHGDFMIINYNSHHYMIRFMKDEIYNHYHQFLISKYYELMSF